MKKFVLMCLVTLMTVPAFATEQSEMIEAETDAQAQALEEGYIPADLLDQAIYQEQAADQDQYSAEFRPPGRRPGPPGRRPGPPPRRQWECAAQDRQGFRYIGRDRELRDARREAMRTCEFRSRMPRSCRLIGCR